MNAIDRTLPPQSRVSQHIDLKEVQKIGFGNDVPLYYISAGIEDVIKLEFCFDAGSKFQSKPLIANAVNELLQNGTNSRNQLEINSEIEKYGAFLETYINADSAFFVIYSLNKHLPKVLEYVKEMLFESNFPEKELQNYLRHHKQKFQINNKKVDYLARKAFQVQIFGEDHPYGKMVNLDDFQNVNRQDLLDFHRKHYSLNNLTIYASGYVAEGQISLLEKYFGTEQVNSTVSTNNWEAEINIRPQNYYQEKNDAVQSAIRIGRRLFTREHPDFIGLQFLATILGGYFGSRLMRNIREDKGYTYGVGSAVVSFLHEGYFFVTTEVGVDVTKATLAEIYKEMNLLCNEKVPLKEIELVKNYIYGKLLRSFDGPFSAMEKFVSIHKFGLDNNYFYKQFKEIANMDADHLLNLANTYLKPSDMIEVVVGKKK